MSNISFQILILLGMVPTQFGRADDPKKMYNSSSFLHILVLLGTAQTKLKLSFLTQFRGANHCPTIQKSFAAKLSRLKMHNSSIFLQILALLGTAHSKLKVSVLTQFRGANHGQTLRMLI